MEGYPLKTAAQTLATLQARVRERLQGRVHHFRVELPDSGLVLHGRAQSFHAKQLAQHAVMEATRTPIGRNNIEVSY